MKFTDSSGVESLVWNMKLSDFPRGQNRSLINDLMNGCPPYTDEEVKDNGYNTNVNTLHGPEVVHAARRQLTQALVVPDPLFTVGCDYGPVWKRQEYSQIITKEANRIVRGSRFFMETQRSTIAQNVLHGVGPSSWKDDYHWCPRADGIEDILIPSDTLVSLENLTYFAKYRSYTVREIWGMTHGSNVDAGWNVDLVESACKWADTQAQVALSNKWPEIWSPEKMSERLKQDSGLYSSDAVPTIDVYDFFYWDDEKGREGWRRKMVLDAWGFPGVGGVVTQEFKDMAPDRKRYGMEKSQFLYDSDKRNDPVYAGKIDQIIHFQFADCSSVAPFRYHSVRSLGYLLYSVCHLENRLNCKFNDAVFEHMMQYFRVSNMGDAQRALQIDLTDKRPLPDGVQFVKPEERWRIDKQLVQMAMATQNRIIQTNSEAFTHSFDDERGDSETATRTMSKLSNSAGMVSAMVGQAYVYKKYQYQEICRRLCLNTNESQDTDANKFRSACIRQGVPEGALDVERWDIEPNRIIAGGNKMLQVAMMDKVMTLYFPRLDPSAQKELLRMGLSITTDDYALANRLVPEQPKVSGSKHDAQLAASVMVAGLPMDFKDGVNHDEYAEELLKALTVNIQQIQARGRPVDQQELIGIQNLAGQTIDGQPVPGGNGVAPHIAALAQQVIIHLKGHADEKSTKQKVKQLSDALSQTMNKVKQMVQQAAEMMKKQQSEQGQPQLDQKDQAKIQAILMTAKAKQQLAAQSHAERTAQKQIAFEQQMKQKQEKHAQDVIHGVHRHEVEQVNSRLRALNGE